MACHESISLTYEKETGVAFEFVSLHSRQMCIIEQKNVMKVRGYLFGIGAYRFIWWSWMSLGEGAFNQQLTILSPLSRRLSCSARCIWGDIVHMAPPPFAPILTDETFCWRLTETRCDFCSWVQYSAWLLYRTCTCFNRCKCVSITMLHTSKDMDVGVSLAGLRGGQGAAANQAPRHLRRAVQLLERVQQSQQPTKY